MILIEIVVIVPMNTRKIEMVILAAFESRGNDLVLVESMIELPDAALDSRNIVKYVKDGS